METLETTLIDGSATPWKNSAACPQAGAKPVYDTERLAIAEQAQQMLEDSRCQDRSPIIDDFTNVPIMSLATSLQAVGEHCVALTA